MINEPTPLQAFKRHAQTFGWGALAGAVITGISVMAWHNRNVEDRDYELRMNNYLMINYSTRSRYFEGLIMKNGIKYSAPIPPAFDPRAKIQQEPIEP